jgi:glycosyltransferase involved in cell wall biosynthesis
MSRLLAYGSNPVALARARSALAARDGELSALTAHARDLFEQGELELAAAWAQIAAFLGWARPGTQLVAPELEAMLVEIGRRVVAEPAARMPSPQPRTVLHVMTEAYATGGHTRVVERWVARDPRTATVVLTDHRDPLPPNMVERLERSDARLIPALAADDLLGRARELRALAGEHDLVVVHAHMHDVVPTLAFAEPTGRPPVVFFDHAAHQLWLGTATADVIGSMREVEDRIVVERRGFPAARLARLPIPHAPRALPDRGESRARIGLSPDQPLILAVASAWKVRPVLEPSFAAICDEVLRASPDATLYVVGPPADEQWRAVVARHRGRIALPGVVADLLPLLAAADVYLDTWPASGGTTIVDVAAAGLPVVSYDDGSDDLGMVRVVAPLGDGAVSVDTPQGVAAAVAELLHDDARRAAMSAALRSAVERDHGSGWNDHLERLVAAAVTHAGAAEPVAPQRADAADWQCMMELMYAPTRPSLAQVIMMNAATLPPVERPADALGYQALADLVLERHGRAGEDAADPPRALAQPAVTAAAIDATVARFRELVASGAVRGCVVVLGDGANDLDEGLRLLQAALDAGGDLEIDVVQGTTVGALRRDGDVVVDAPAAAQGALSASS